MYGGLRSAFEFIELWGTTGQASRPMYADFLDEAGAILGKSALHSVADKFRTSGEMWGALSRTLLPDKIPLFREARELLLMRSQLFLEQGAASLLERKQITARLEKLREVISENFPLQNVEVVDFRDSIKASIFGIYEAEREAVLALRDLFP
ncbi:MAG: DUF4872 domain-containing protein [Chloroflexi bacterium]|nr:DUF4872 domain-containing protein [Chloroflexota bacterium]